MKKDSLAFEKFNLVVITLFTQIFILPDTKFGNSIGNRNINNKTLAATMPDIFKILEITFLGVVFMKATKFINKFKCMN